MIQLLTRFVARDEDCARTFSELLLRLGASVPSEPNNLSYEVYGSSEPGTFFCLESWVAQEDMDRHIAKNEDDGVNREASELLTSAPETTIIRPFNSTSGLAS